MKAINYIVVLCLTLMFGLVSCGDDIDIPSAGAPDQAETRSLGSYVGEWSITNTKTGKVDVYQGTITFDPYVVVNKDGSEYVERNVNLVTATCDGGNLRLEAESCGCNISSNSAGYLQFWNVYNMNPFKITFLGEITPEGDLKFQYDKDVRSGRGNNKVKYNYLFKGKKS